MLWNDEDMSIKCVISAGKNKYGRDQFVACWEDDPSWYISVVPSVINKTRAYEMISRIKKEYPELSKSNPRMYPPDKEFKIELYDEFHKYSLQN